MSKEQELQVFNYFCKNHAALKIDAINDLEKDGLPQVSAEATIDAFTQVKILSRLQVGDRTVFCDNIPKASSDEELQMHSSRNYSILVADDQSLMFIVDENGVRDYCFENVENRCRQEIQQRHNDLISHEDCQQQFIDAMADENCQ